MKILKVDVAPPGGGPLHRTLDPPLSLPLGAEASCCFDVDDVRSLSRSILP